MSRDLGVRREHAVFALIFGCLLALTACSGGDGGSGSATASPGMGTSTPPAAPTPAPTPVPTDDGTPGPGPTGPGDGGPSSPGDSRFILDCIAVDGASAQFATLADAWASPDYVRITGCTAGPARDDIVLTPDEQQVAALVDGGADPLTAFLQAFAACVRIPPDRIPEQPTGLLRGVQALCPKAPEAGLVSSALQDRGDG